jgi:hypothetical protein
LKEDIMIEFDKTNIPSKDGSKLYRKKVLTRAWRVEVPFKVKTSEGDLTCAGGYLAVDARGYPYPIAKDEFDLIYEPVAETKVEGEAQV